jgi:hypothetical protein
MSLIPDRRNATSAVSIRGTIDLQAVATGLSVKVLLGEAVERLLELLRLARRRHQRQQQDFAQPELKRRRAAVHARIAGVHQRERDRTRLVRRAPEQPAKVAHYRHASPISPLAAQTFWVSNRGQPPTHSLARLPRRVHGQKLEPISKSSKEDNEAGELEVSRPGNFTVGLSQNRANYSL